MNVVPVLISAIRLPPRRDVEDEPALVDQKALQDIEVLLATDKRSATNDFPDSLSQNCLALKVVPTTHCHDGHEQKRFGLLEIIGRHFCRNDHKGEMLTHRHGLEETEQWNLRVTAGSEGASCRRASKPQV